jgi:cytidine deaminase
MKPTNTVETLYNHARTAMKRAYCRYSCYQVGAALITKSGAFFYGCNFENISYGLTICAERNAIGTMISECGEEQITELLIVASGSTFPSPCGACRQVIAEFSTPETKVHFARARENGNGFELRTYRVSALLPLTFTQSSMSEALEESGAAISSDNVPQTPVYSYSEKEVS